MSNLTNSGVDVKVLNRPHGLKDLPKYIFPYTGTNHTKGTYVFDQEEHDRYMEKGIPDMGTTFYFSTANHEDEPRMNMIIKFGGPLAARLKEEFSNLHTNPPSQDYVKQLSDNTWIYVDSGIPGKSIIMDKGLDLARNSKQSIQLTTLFHPEGRLAKTVQQKSDQWKTEAKTDINLDIITTKFSPNIPVVTVNGTFYLIDLISRAQAKLHNNNFPVLADNNRWIHSKCEITDGEWLFIGSHNYSESGVKAGTREWQLLTSNPDIVLGAQRMFRDYKEMVCATSSETSLQSQLF